MRRSVNLEKRFLKGVLGGLTISGEAVQKAEKIIVMPIDQGAQGLIIATLIGFKKVFVRNLMQTLARGTGWALGCWWVLVVDRSLWCRGLGLSWGLSWGAGVGSETVPAARFGVVLRTPTGR